MKTKILMAMLALVGLSAMAQENDTVSVQVNDSTALVEQSDSVKKNVRVLWVNAEVRDHLTHDIMLPTAPLSIAFTEATTTRTDTRVPPSLVAL